MSAIEPRINAKPWRCPWCPETVPAGEAVWPVKTASVESLACTACAWRHENGYPLRRQGA